MEKDRGRTHVSTQSSFLFKIKPTQPFLLLTLGQSPGLRRSMTATFWPPAWKLESLLSGQLLATSDKAPCPFVRVPAESPERAGPLRPLPDASWGCPRPFQAGGQGLGVRQGTEALGGTGLGSALT